jgi:hypothetical protein
MQNPVDNVSGLRPFTLAPGATQDVLIGMLSRLSSSGTSRLGYYSAKVVSGLNEYNVWCRC